MANHDFLKSTARLRRNLISKPDTEIKAVIGEWMDERIKVGQSLLESEGRNGTSALSTSLRTEVENGKDTIVNVLAEDYWDFINSGVNGVQNKFGAKYSFKNMGVGIKMKESFKKFIRDRNIQPRDEKTSYDQLAYILAKATKKKGIEPTPFMDKAFNKEAIKDLSDRLGKTIVKLITD